MRLDGHRAKAQILLSDSKEASCQGASSQQCLSEPQSDVASSFYTFFCDTVFCPLFFNTDLGYASLGYVNYHNVYQVLMSMVPSFYPHL